MIFEAEEFTEIMNVEIIKPIQQQQQFKSARPSIPIEADDESEIDTIDFMDTDIEGFGEWGTPPPPRTHPNTHTHGHNTAQNRGLSTDRRRRRSRRCRGQLEPESVAFSCSAANT